MGLDRRQSGPAGTSSDDTQRLRTIHLLALRHRQSTRRGEHPVGAEPPLHAPIRLL